MKQEMYSASGLLMCAGTLLAVSGMLTAICVQPAYSVSLWAVASCMFFTAWNFQVNEEKLSKATEGTENE